MKKIIYILFTLLFVSNLQAHKAHDDALLQDLQSIMSKKGFESIKENIKDFSLESHFVYKDTKEAKKLLEVLTKDVFNKKEYETALKDVYKNEEHAKNVSTKKSAEVLAKLSKEDRAVFANILKRLNTH